MTFEELLKAQNLTDEQVKGITGAMKENKIYTSAEENIDIRYKKLSDKFEALTSQHDESAKLIEQLKAGTKNSEELQGQITAYEGKMTTMQGEYDQKVQALEAKLAEEQLKNAINLALRDAKCNDADYMAYNLKKKYGSELALGEDGKIKGMDDKIAGLKTQFPEQFKGIDGQRKVDPQPLPGSEDNSGVTKEDFAKMGYQQRVKIFNDNPELYSELSK